MELKVIGDRGDRHEPRPLGKREDWALNVLLDGQKVASLSIKELLDLEPRPFSADLKIRCVSAGRVVENDQNVNFGGVRFSRLLEGVFPVGPPDGIRTVRFISGAPGKCGPKRDKHWTSLPLEVCLAEENQVIIANSLNGHSLPYQHGQPLRSVVGPTLYFYKGVKWLDTIDFVSRPIDECRGTWEEYAGYHNLGWADGNKFEPRMRVIREVKTDANGDLYEESDLVAPEDWQAFLGPKLEERNLSSLIAARLDKMGITLPDDYSDFKFSDGDFKAQIRGTSFKGCKFYRARLAGGNFSLCNFINAQFSRDEGKDAADLLNCDFEGAFFQNAYLRKVKMGRSYLAGVTFTRDFARSSDNVLGLDVREALDLDQEVRDWLHLSGADVYKALP